MTAVFAFSDVLAIGAAKAVIDTVYQPATEMALSAVSLLHGMMNGDKCQHMVYESVIMKRGSVRMLSEEGKE